MQLDGKPRDARRRPGIHHIGGDSLSKTGIALAGGGPLGGIYEIGASVALAEAIDGFEFNQADIFVGVSSGGLIAAALANGINPARLARILIDDGAEEIFDPEMLLRPALQYLSRCHYPTSWFQP
jgi:predicted acylesterase/phospholipase RssA